MSEENEEGVVEVTPEEAVRVLEEKRAERVRAVEQGLQDLCRAHNCVLDVQMNFSTLEPPRGQIVVVPRD